MRQGAKMSSLMTYSGLGWVLTLRWSTVECDVLTYPFDGRGFVIIITPWVEHTPQAWCTDIYTLYKIITSHTSPDKFLNMLEICSSNNQCIYHSFCLNIMMYIIPPPTRGGNRWLRPIVHNKRLQVPLKRNIFLVLSLLWKGLRWAQISSLG